MTPSQSPPTPPAETPAPPHARRTNRVHVAWVADQLFDGGRPGAKAARFDGHGTLGPGPMDALLSALVVCASLDVVEILRKRRTPAESLAVDAVGERADKTPARLVAVKLTYDITGPGIDRDAIERAVDLSLSKYCSVRQSLDPAIVIEFAVTLNGEPGQFRLSENAAVGLSPNETRK